ERARVRLRARGRGGRPPRPRPAGLVRRHAGVRGRARHDPPGPLSALGGAPSSAEAIAAAAPSPCRPDRLDRGGAAWMSGRDYLGCLGVLALLMLLSGAGVGTVVAFIL